MCGYDAGSVEDDPAEDDDFELDLEAVDVVSFALAVVSLGFNALVSGSIAAATAPVTRGFGPRWLANFFLPHSEGAYAVSIATLTPTVHSHTYR